MELDFTWLLLALPVTFALGWLASRLDVRQWKIVSQSTHKPFFEGLNHLLNAREDQAIDAFIQTAQQDPQATELYFALGNLFRNRGDHDRAIRVYEHLLQRPDLSETERQRARQALAQAFLRAGILDRAEAQLIQLTESPLRDEALMALLGLYERTSEWPKALSVAQRLQVEGQLDFSSRMAHYHCELAHSHLGAAGSLGQHEQALRQSPWHIRTHMELADADMARNPGRALDRMLELVRHSPKALPLLVQRLIAAAQATGRSNEVHDLLSESHRREPSLDVLQGLIELIPPEEVTTRQELLLNHLQREPSLVVANQWLQLVGAKETGLPEAVTQAMQRACAPLRRYRCAACGFETTRHFWQCPGCQTWDSYPMHRVEEL